MTWLKKGDRIKMLCDAGNLKKGETYTINIVDENDTDCPYYVNNERWVCSDQFAPAYEFHVGQIYRIEESIHDEDWNGSIFKISGETREHFGGRFTTNPIRGKVPDCFDEGSIVAKNITLLTGSEIGEAIRKWDAEHSETGVKEIKRKAEVGEYIKTLCNSELGRFKKGDILKVTDDCHDCDTWRGKAVGYNGTHNVIQTEKYVVLEGYKPEQKEEHRKAKVGDTVKVLHDNGGRVYAGTVWKVKSVDSDGTLCITSTDDGLTWACNKDNYIVVSSGKRSYTPKQIEKAKKLCGEMMVEALDDGKCCDVTKKEPCKEFEKRTGKKMITAEMANESQMRETEWYKSGCNGFSTKRPKSMPMAFWTEQDVLAYLKTTGLPYCSVYGDIVADNEGQTELFETTKHYHCTGCQRTGCMFCMFGVHLEQEPNRFQRMKITHPKQYDYCINQLGIGKVLDYIHVKY